jgi:hypothetical protein
MRAVVVRNCAFLFRPAFRTVRLSQRPLLPGDRVEEETCRFESRATSSKGRFVDVTGGAVAELVNRAPPDVFAEVARR